MIMDLYRVKRKASVIKRLLKLTKDIVYKYGKLLNMQKTPEEPNGSATVTDNTTASPSGSVIESPMPEEKFPYRRNTSVTFSSFDHVSPGHCPKRY